MVDGDDQLLKPVDELGHELFKCRAVKGICKLIDEIVSIQRPKDAVPLTSCVLVSDSRPAANREPAVCEVGCYGEDAFVQK